MFPFSSLSRFFDRQFKNMILSTNSLFSIPKGTYVVMSNPNQSTVRKVSDGYENIFPQNFPFNDALLIKNRMTRNGVLMPPFFEVSPLKFARFSDPKLDNEPGFNNSLRILRILNEITSEALAIQSKFPKTDMKPLFIHLQHQASKLLPEHYMEYCDSFNLDP